MGVFLVWVLSERYGWPQSGLVVPGYLASVFAIQPSAGAAVVVEAVVTYWVALSISRGLPRVLPLVQTFGRDRFFLVLLVSVFVRLFFEAGPWTHVMAGVGLTTVGPLHSLGLVLVPLAANAMWQAGFWRGVPIVGLPVLVSYLVLRFVLLAHTNLSFSSFALTYEDLSIDFTATPRAYMLLLTGALFATWMGVRYGWDSGGIIIPGLLAVIWMYPEKLAATLGEVILVVLLVRGLTLLPPLRTSNLTGMRPLMLALTVGYAVKLVVSAVAGEMWPGLRVNDLFGFGYLLPSLVAVRCWRYGSFTRVLVPATATALAAFLTGTLAGYGMERLRPVPESPPPGLTGQSPGPASLVAVELLLAPSDATHPDALTEIRDSFLNALEGRPYTGDLLRTDVYPDGLVLHSGEKNLTGTAWIRGGSTGDLVVWVPDAAQRPGLAEAGVTLADALGARALLLSPAPPLRSLATDEIDALLEVTSAPVTTLSVAGRLPTEIDLNQLNTVVPSLVPDWDLSDETGVDVRLALSEDAIVSAAVRSFDGPVRSGRPLLLDPEGRPVLPQGQPNATFNVNRLVLLDRGVVSPLLEARRGTADWARVAASHAARMGLAVWRDETVGTVEEGGVRTLLGVGPAEDRDPPHFALWLPAETRSPYIFEVRAGGRHHLAVDVARTWWAATHASALLVHDASVDLDADALRRAGPDAPEGTILRALARDDHDATVVSIAGFEDDEYPGADAVISIGRPIATEDKVPFWLKPVRRLVEGAGGTAAWYDGSPPRVRFYDPANPRRDVVEYAGGHYATVYLSPMYRLRFASPLTSAVLQAVFRSSNLPLRDGSLEIVTSGRLLPASAVGDQFQGVLAGLARHAATGHPGELARLVQKAHDRGILLWAFVDAEDGLPYLVAEGPTARLVAPLGRGRGVLAEAPDGPDWVRIDGYAVAVAVPGGGP